MKKFISSLLVIMISLSLITGCSKPAEKTNNDSNQKNVAEGFKFERKIELICPWGAGGGADTTLRTFASALEKELGVPVVVNNKEGAGGTAGVEYATKQPADGYTWLLCTQSPLLASIKGSSTVDVFGSITPVTRLVHDTNMLVTGKTQPYKTFDELMAYIDANPGKVKCGVMSITGLDGLTVHQMFDGKVEAVAYNNGAELNAAVMGGHVSLACVGPAEVLGLVKSGDFVPLIIASEKRMTMEEYKDVVCSGEKGIEAYFGPYRGIFAKNGTPEEAIKAFEEAAAKAVASQEFQDWTKTVGLDQRPGYLNRADFTKVWTEDNDILTKLVKELDK